MLRQQVAANRREIADKDSQIAAKDSELSANRSEIADKDTKLATNSTTIEELLQRDVVALRSALKPLSLVVSSSTMTATWSSPPPQSMRHASRCSASASALRPASSNKHARLFSASMSEARAACGDATDDTDAEDDQGTDEKDAEAALSCCFGESRFRCSRHPLMASR